MVELYQITREVAPQVVGDKREAQRTKNLNAESSSLIKENLPEGQSFTARESGEETSSAERKPCEAPFQEVGRKPPRGKR
jgi:hypothetical protein